MAASTNRGVTWNTNSGNKTVVATPAVGDLIIVVAAATGGGPTAIADTQAGSAYTQISTNRTGFSTSGILNAWVRTALIPAASSTTWTATETSSTGGGLWVVSVAGMSRAGASAIRGSGGQSTGTSGTTPAPVLSVTPLATNTVVTAVCAATNVTAQPIGTGVWNWPIDSAYATPATTIDGAFADSGVSSATVTWGSTCASVFASIAFELDTSPVFNSSEGEEHSDPKSLQILDRIGVTRGSFFCLGDKWARRPSGILAPA